MINLNISDLKYFNIKIILGFLALICFFSTLNIVPPLDRDESRYIQATVQMLETKDFVNINFLESPRLKKPPGIYWLQAISAVGIKNIFFLDSVPIWAFRIPSAIGASVSIWVTFLLGQFLFGRAQGLIAALLLMSSPIVIMESHIAKTDSVLLALFLCALYILVKIVFYEDKKLPKPSDITVFAFWIIMSFTFLIKGPIALVILLLTIISYKVLKEPINFKDLKPIMGIILFMLIILPWFILINSGNNNDVLFNTIKKDMLLKLVSVQESHGAPPGSYLLSSMLTAWPIALFIIPSALWCFKNKDNKSVKFLLCSLIPSWLFFEIIPTKLLHYVLPLLPSFAILTAAMIISSVKGIKFRSISENYIFKFLSALPFLGGAIIAAGIIYIGNRYGEGLTLSILLIASIYLFSSFLCGYFLYIKSFIKAALVVIICNIIALKLLIILIPNQLQKIWISERIYSQIQDKNLSEVFLLLGYSEPSLIFRLGSQTKIVSSNNEAIDLILNKKINYIIIEKFYLDQFKKLSEKNGIVINAIGNSILGFNYSKGKNVEVIVMYLNQ
ncbi:MAG: glycosyltransferase family 39 protein [Alphaproteobacteria bacterium]|jgi:4-amino-4-deoxy-L-arabinose transferase-like glycosyltransferase|nr:glycosyltransferase family 39 protein [Alphaproteobacteria bacterium]